MVKNPRIWAAQQIQGQLELYATLSPPKKKLEKGEEEEKKKKGGAPRLLKGHYAFNEHIPCPLSFIFPLPEERESQHHMFCVHLLVVNSVAAPGQSIRKCPD